KCVHRRSVEAHLQHGDPLGDCSVEPGPQTCSGATLPCNPNLSSCGDGCFCFVTTAGGSFCAGNGTVECIAGGACAVDRDCVDRLGDGYVCVSTAGCGDDIPGCTDTSNACAGPCQQG
ncbi:MAG TPA: hypothetical protein VFX03_04875, partial [Thermomicrobiales bacterium]|nr:hypothetical protein [Thermomicrobiales bacterium]